MGDGWLLTYAGNPGLLEIQGGDKLLQGAGEDCAWEGLLGIEEGFQLPGKLRAVVVAEHAKGAGEFVRRRGGIASQRGSERCGIEGFERTLKRAELIAYHRQLALPEIAEQRVGALASLCLRGKLGGR